MINNTNRIMSNALEMPELTCFEDLVRETRLSANLIYWLSKKDAKGKYRTFYIDKSNGKKREINAPVGSLKILQRWVLEEILYKIKPSKYAYGFKKGENGSPIFRCAEKHKNNTYLLKLDLKSFYPSIKRERIFYEFVNIGYNSRVANLLTNICSLKDSLPQGAVTSAFLANLICFKLDARIAGYCNKRNITYTRYADDLAFSGNDRDLLRNIFGMIKRIVEDEGFQLNDKKTMFMTPKNHKLLLGVTINNDRTKASKEVKRRIRAMIHYSMVTGDYSLNERIRGYISYINSIEDDYRKNCIDYINKLTQSSLSLFDEIVEEYNKNKLFKELPNMKVKNPSDFVKQSEVDNFMSDLYYERREFLIKHGIYED